MSTSTALPGNKPINATIHDRLSAMIPGLQQMERETMAAKSLFAIAKAPGLTAQEGRMVSEEMHFALQCMEDAAEALRRAGQALAHAIPAAHH